MPADPAPSGGPGSVSSTWSEDAWMRLEADLTRTLRAERLRLHRNLRRAKSAQVLRAARRPAAPVARPLGARPLYWVLLAAAVLTLLLLVRF